MPEQLQLNETETEAGVILDPLHYSTVQIPRHFIQSGLLARMSSTSWNIYCVLRSYAHPETGRAWPGTERISELIDRKHDTIGRGIEELEKLGLLYLEYPGGGGRTRMFRLIDRYSAQMLDPQGNIVNGQVIMPYLPKYDRAVLKTALALCLIADPSFYKPSQAEIKLDYIRFHDGQQWVFAVHPKGEGAARMFFSAVGAPDAAVDRFYASALQKIELDIARRNAAFRLAQEDEGF